MDPVWSWKEFAAPQCSSRFRVRVDIRACYGMTQGYGANVRAFIDGQWHVRRLAWMATSYNSNAMYFPVPEGSSIDVLLVEWVGGNQTVVTDVAAGSSLLIFEDDDCSAEDDAACDLSLACGEGTYWEASIGQCLPVETCLGDLNADNVITTSDLLVFLSLFGTYCE